MREVLLTSSVLIAALLALRRLFRNTIPRRVQYALWALVLVRLLVPVSLPAAKFSVMSAAEPVQARVEARLERRPVYVLPVAHAPFPEELGEPEGEPAVFSDGGRAGYAVTSEDNSSVTFYALTAAEALALVWKAGTAVMAGWLLYSNLSLWRRLRKGRRPYPAEGCKRPVWLVEEGLPTPCVFGLFRPAIYLTPAALSSPESLRHVLAHEETHARRRDPLWSLLRGVCLAVYWFDPLVWWAALASRTDCELSCDEAAIRRLGEEERLAYGRTLLSLIPVRKAPMDPMLSATTMSSGKRQLKERITRIAENRRTVAAALLAAIVVTALVCAVTFTRADVGTKAGEDQNPSRPLTAEELRYFNEEFFNGTGESFSNRFLTSLYERPEDIDLMQLFYNGAEENEDIGEEEYRLLQERFDADGRNQRLWVKMSLFSVNVTLVRYTGLTLDQTNRVGWQDAPYLEEYRSYYTAAGDSNYPSSFVFTAGEREGDLVRLYYENRKYDINSWACVTLRETEDGGYWFVSNLPCGEPAVTAAPPEKAQLTFYLETAWLTIPLDDLEPYEPVQMTPEAVSADAMGELLLQKELSSGETLLCYWEPGSEDTKYWALRDPDGVTMRFCREESAYRSSYGAAEFTGLFGHDGFIIEAPRGAAYYALDYYYLDEDGMPRLLAECAGEAYQMDWNGDGEDELLSCAYHGPSLYFRRDGVLYCADLVNLIQSADPRCTVSGGAWDADTGRLIVTGRVKSGNTSEEDTCWWSVYFVGEIILVFQETQPSDTYVPALPEEEPWLTIPLDGLEPYQAPEPAVERSTGEGQEMLAGWTIPDSEYSVMAWRAGDGDIYYSTQRSVLSSWPGTWFLRLEYDAWPEALHGEEFYNVLGHDGLKLSYPVMMGTSMTAYYYFEEDGTPRLLAQGAGYWEETDLDGDGQRELIWQVLGAEEKERVQLLFRRDGQLYQASVFELLQNAWPEAQGLTYMFQDSAARVLGVYGYVTPPGMAWDMGLAWRWIYFDGDDLLVYRDTRKTVDHVMEGCVAPAEVLEAARARALAWFQTPSQGRILENGEFLPVEVEKDDWRVEGVDGPWYEDAGEFTVEVWYVNYEEHVTTPERLTLPGASYLTEDCWYSNGIGEYLLFRMEEDGGRTLLHTMEYSAGVPSSRSFRTVMIRELTALGLL